MSCCSSPSHYSRGSSCVLSINSIVLSTGGFGCSGSNFSTTVSSSPTTLGASQKVKMSSYHASGLAFLFSFQEGIKSFQLKCSSLNDLSLRTHQLRIRSRPNKAGNRNGNTSLVNELILDESERFSLG